MIDYEQKAEYFAWVNKRLGSELRYETARVLTSLDQGGRILGIVVFSRFRAGDCEVTVCGDAGWLQRRLVLASLAYVFDILKCRRVTAFVAVGNSPSLNLAQQLGFKIEGTVREWFPSGDAYVLGLLPRECKIYQGRLNGQRKPPSST